MSELEHFYTLVGDSGVNFHFFKVQVLLQAKSRNYYRSEILPILGPALEELLRHADGEKQIVQRSNNINVDGMSKF
jgi:hypothetical protein